MDENFDENRIIEFYEIIYDLKKKIRRGWEQKGIKHPENVADHIFAVSLLALVLGKKLRLNIEKCLIIALLHDIGEALNRDITPSDGLSKEEKSKLETNATYEVLSKIDDSGNLKKLWEEFEFEQSQEGIFIKQIDKLEMALQAYYYEIDNKTNMEEFFINAEKRLTNDELLLIFKRLLEIRNKAIK